MFSGEILLFVKKQQEASMTKYLKLQCLVMHLQSLTVISVSSVSLTVVYNTCLVSIRIQPASCVLLIDVYCMMLQCNEKKTLPQSP